MAGVSTVALIERKTSISRSLFTRYWRDVHGVMAVRIPGFESYTQYHVFPMDDVGSTKVEPFEGIAIVTYACEADRQGLIHSAVTQHIHRDEQNVFARALLYNLDVGASRIVSGPVACPADAIDMFLTVAEGTDDFDLIITQLSKMGALQISRHDLTGGDPSGWNDTAVDEGGKDRRFIAVLHTIWTNEATGIDAMRSLVAQSGGMLTAYRGEQRYVMVEHGRATTIGLRGLDAALTIEEAGATNQLADDVVKAIYGVGAN